MYCDYWNLKKQPFDNVPDPSMYADCHTSMENVISETIFAIKEANEAFAVIIGSVGLGKTLSLRIIIDSLESDKYKVVLITNPSLSFTQLLREIIGQITGKQCEENRKVDLLEIFNHLLFQTIDQGRKIVIFIDEANSLSPANLENLRLLTNMQDDQRNLFTLVLAGQLELAQRLEHPKRANLFQRIGTYGRIDKLPSEEAVRSYIEKRLQFAGTKIKIFSEDCIPVIWKYSDEGVPRLINKLCKLCLKAGETNNFDYIQADTVIQIAERFQKLSKTAVQMRKPRVRLDKAVIPEVPAPLLMDNLSEIASSFEVSPKLNSPQQNIKNVILFPLPADDSEEKKKSLEISVMNTMAIPETPDPVLETVKPDDSEKQTITVPPSAANQDTEPGSFEEPNSESPAPGMNTSTTISDVEIKPIENKPLELPVIEASPLPEAAGQIIETVSQEDSKQQTKTAESLSAAHQVSDTLSDKDPLSPSPVPEVAADSIISDSKPKEESPALNTSLDEAAPLEPAKENAITDNEVHEVHEAQPHAEKPVRTVEENDDEVIIGEHRIQLGIPKDILKQVKSFNRASANKSAGFWAAQIIKKNPQLTRSPQADPVHIWNEIKDNILRKIAV